MAKTLTHLFQTIGFGLFALSCSPPFESDTSERNKSKAPIVPIRDVGQASQASEDQKFKDRLKGKWGWIERAEAPWIASNSPTSTESQALAFKCTGYFDESMRFLTSQLCPDSCADIKIKVWINDELSLDGTCTNVESVSTPKSERLFRYTLDGTIPGLSELSGLRLSTNSRASLFSAVKAVGLKTPEVTVQPSQKALIFSPTCEAFGPREQSPLGSHTCALRQAAATQLFYAPDENSWVGISPVTNSPLASSLIISQDLIDLK